MEFEGKEISIPIKGIMRAGADSVAPDGAMNEVIGLEYKDGSYVPYKAEAVGSGTVVLPQNTSIIRVHKTSTQENVVIIRTDGTIAWEAKDDFDSGGDFEELDNITNAQEMDFIGNVICVKCSDKIRFLMFDADTSSYKEQKTTYSQLPAIRLGVTAGLYDEENDSAYYIGRKSVISNRLASPTTSGQLRDMWESAILPAIKNKNIGSSLLTKANALQTEAGGLTGYIVACVAYRLKNGSYVAASAPILLCPPNIRYTEELSGMHVGCYAVNTDDAPGAVVGTDEGDINQSYFPDELDAGDYVHIDEENVGVLHCGAADRYTELTNGTNSTWYRLLTGDAFQKGETVSESNFSVKPILCAKKANWGDGPDTGDEANFFVRGEAQNNDDSWSPIHDDTYPQYQVSGSPLYVKQPPLTSSIAVLYQSHEDEVWITQVAAGASNKLMIQIPSNDLGDSKDLIEGVGIFLSPEISPFMDVTQENNIKQHGLFKYGSLSNTADVQVDYSAYAYTYTPKYRTIESIKEDIKKVSNLYLVKFFSTEEISGIEAGAWMNVNLKGLLGDSLRTLPSISIGTLVQSTSILGNMFSYNSRLHVFGYTSEYGVDNKLWSQQYLANSAGQRDKDLENDAWIFGVDEQNDTYVGGQIIVKSDIGEGNIIKKVYYFPEGAAFYSSPIFSVKGINIQSIVLKLKKIENYSIEGSRTYQIYERELDFITNDGLGIAYIINDRLNPIPLAGKYNRGRYYVEWITATISEYNSFFESPNAYYTAKNGIRIADTAYPYYFDNKSTLKVGNGEIIGMARLSIALSQDTYGSNPVLVFCTDGIYTLGVDTTGSGAYTVITPFSREVCISRKSICEVDGAVLFVSSKGLMIASADGVKEFMPSLNGKPRHYPSPQSAKGLGLRCYYDVIANDKSVQLNGVVSALYEDFIDYAKDSNTAISYISVKNKVLVYNRGKDYVYWIDIPTRIVTKLAYKIFTDNNNYPEEEFYYIDGNNKPAMHFNYEFIEQVGGVQKTVDCMFQTRPIKIAQGLKGSFRVAVRGYFENTNYVEQNIPHYAALLVLGSYDGEVWQPVGYKQKPLRDGFHSINCVTDRVSYNYMMIVFAGQLNKKSHIDGIDITVEGRYNKKLSNV